MVSTWCLHGVYTVTPWCLGGITWSMHYAKTSSARCLHLACIIYGCYLLGIYMVSKWCLHCLRASFMSVVHGLSASCTKSMCISSMTALVTLLSARGECLLTMSSVWCLEPVLSPNNLSTNYVFMPCNSPTSSYTKVPKRKGLTNMHPECS